MLRPGSRKNQYVLIGVILLIAALAGVLAGSWLSSRWAARTAEADELRRLDEYQGLAERSGIRKDLVLDVQPAVQTVDRGRPIRLTVRLTNRGERKLTVNSWLWAYPAGLGSNQLPLKMDVRRAGESVRYRGDAVVLPLHAKKDFFVLGPGEHKTTTIDLLNPGGRGHWEMSTPGTYQVAIWYETYLSGKWIGVKAWTGMTNPMVVQVVVRPRGG